MERKGNMERLTQYNEEPEEICFLINNAENRGAYNILDLARHRDTNSDFDFDEFLLKVAKKLKEYEDMEEQGKLLRLPCKFGDTVFVKMQSGGHAQAEVRDFIHFLSCGFCVVVTSDKFDKQNIPFSEFGKTIFLTCPDDGNVN